MTRIAKFLIYVVSIVCGASQPWAQEPEDFRTEQKVREEIGWHSRNNNLNDLPRRIAELYLGLFNMSRLTVTLYKDTEGKYIERIFTDRGLLFGNGFPTELDSLACDLNTHVCTRERKVAPADILSDYTKHIGGFLPSQGRWRNGKNDWLWLPNVALSVERDIRVYTKAAGEKLSTIVIKKRSGCERYNEECKIYLDFLNRGIKGYDRDDYAGKIMVPTLSVTAVVDISCRYWCAGGIHSDVVREAQPLWSLEEYPSIDVAIEVAKKPLIVQDVEESSPTDVKVPEELLRASEDWVDGLSIAGDISARIKALSDSLFASIKKASPQSVLTDESLFRHQSFMFEFIDFPFVKHEFPEAFRKRVNVAVLDKEVDKDHCDFNSTDWIVENLPRHREPEQRHACPTLLQQGQIDWDHGTHVVGIIAADLNSRGMVGLNPFARIISYEVDFTNLGKLEYQRSLAKNLKRIINAYLPYVVNLSFQYYPERQQATVISGTIISGTFDPLRDLMVQQRKSVLFVAAAGNAGQKYSIHCDVYPACFELDNLISVIALKGTRDSPEVLDQSNRGIKFDVGTIGDEIYSTGRLDSYVRLSGTSQAAPQVTAIASLLFAENPRLSPVQVKNRIIVCADPHENLDGKVLSGKLNANCALNNTDKQAIILMPGGEQISGEVKNILDSARDFGLEFLDTKQLLRINFDWHHIQGMHFDQDVSLYSIYKIKNPSNPDDSAVVKYGNLKLIDEDAKLIVKMDGQTRTIRASEIRRYVAPID